MFLWATLPEGSSSIELFNLAIEDKVAFVPGNPFYINKETTNTLRLNFSCVDEQTIEIGIKRLGKSIERLLS
jgi:2-aminoadipate transaminase